MPFCTQRCRTSVFVIMSCHLMIVLRMEVFAVPSGRFDLCILCIDVRRHTTDQQRRLMTNVIHSSTLNIDCSNYITNSPGRSTPPLPSAPGTLSGRSYPSTAQGVPHSTLYSASRRFLSTAPILDTSSPPLLHSQAFH